MIQTSPHAQPLFVPMELNILLVNDQVRFGQAFQRWRYDYRDLSRFESPEPAPFDGNTAANWRNEPQANGAYLHWTLPWSLRHGRHDKTSGKLQFLLVPNRWLIVRYSGDKPDRQETAWVVDSDFIDPNNGAISFVDPKADPPAPTRIGRATPISNWNEPGGSMFLTAVAPGHESFAAFQPGVENVFSFHDPLDGLPDQDRLSYLVIGWYSDASQDALATVSAQHDLNQTLQQLGWRLTNDKAAPNRTVCHGMSLAVTWHKTGPPPKSARPDRPEMMTLAVGNTAVDAVTAIVGQLPGGKAIDPYALEAFQYGLLAHYADPEVHGEVWRAVHAAWFGQERGGYGWHIVDRPVDAGKSDGRDKASPQQLAIEANWLAELNRHQGELDAAMSRLTALQRELYDVWWKRHAVDNLPNAPTMPVGITMQDFDDAFDGSNQSSLVQQVHREIQNVSRLLAIVPWGADQAGLAKSIAAYAALKSLASTRELKRFSKPEFHKPNNPVVVIGGVKNPKNSQPHPEINCRTSDELVEGLTALGQQVNAQSMKGRIPVPNLSRLPQDLQPFVEKLVEEFFFLDPINADAIASIGLNNAAVAGRLKSIMSDRRAVTGTAPDASVIPSVDWQQPWQPLYLQWKINWYPIPYAGQGKRHWTFDGTDYHWDGQSPGPINPIGLHGRIFLTPNVQFNMRARVEDYLAKHPDAALRKVEHLLESFEGWDLMSQSLDGFHEQLLQRQPRVSVSAYGSKTLVQPKLTISDLVGEAPLYAPEPGAYQNPPFQSWPPSEFSGLRSGQFNFTHLVVVDAFGQTAELVTPATENTFAPVKSEGLETKQAIIATSPQRFVQLPPRILPPARLKADFVDNMDDSKILDLEPGVNPISAWLLPNHLDNGLSIFGPSGEALGELRLAASNSGVSEVVWLPAPGSTYQTIGTLQQAHPHLHAMLGQFEPSRGANGAPDFKSFLEAIDASLWGIDPLGARDDQTLSVLIGRPLALARIRLKFEIDGPPPTDPTWRFTFKPRAPDYVDNVFSISLGNASLQQDGLIGYFEGDDYSAFFVSHQPDHGTGYVRAISPGNYIEQSFAENTQTYATILIDPRADVNAYAGVVPAVQLRLPQPIVDDALAAMDVSFLVGPIMTDTVNLSDDKSSHIKTGQTKPAQSNTALQPATAKVMMPLPSARHGQWSWLSGGTGAWHEQSVAPADQVPRLSNIAPQIRWGRLKLSGAIMSKK